MNTKWRSAGMITAGALALYAVMRLLPTGTNLEHSDFSANPDGRNMLELCDPANPQFTPALEVKSPVGAEINAVGLTRAREIVRARLVLRTAGGKQIGPGDLLVSHTEKLHLLIIDESLRDYHHVHPVFEYSDGGGGTGDGDGDGGAWAFSFTPEHSGVYRVFCDFVPAATARPLYASADLSILECGDSSPLSTAGLVTTPDSRESVGAQAGRQAGPSKAAMNRRTPYPEFSLTGEVRARRQATLVLSADAPVGLEPVMDAYAHLVAFDEKRSGFAHLHPLGSGGAALPLSFRVTFPRAGKYVVWAQMRIGGADVFVPFDLNIGGDRK